MSGATGLDIRLPIGGLFSLLGILVGGYGVATRADPARYAPSFGININLWWGLVMLGFGVGLLLLASRSRGKASAHPTPESPEGRATESRERRLGLED